MTTPHSETLDLGRLSENPAYVVRRFLQAYLDSHEHAQGAGDALMIMLPGRNVVITRDTTQSNRFFQQGVGKAQELNAEGLLMLGECYLLKKEVCGSEEHPSEKEIKRLGDVYLYVTLDHRELGGRQWISPLRHKGEELLFGEFEAIPKPLGPHPRYMDIYPQ